MRPRSLVLAVVLTGVLACVAAPAFGYDEPNDSAEEHQSPIGTYCLPCHVPGPPNNAYCDFCHSPHPSVPLGPVAGKGPHGFYTSTTNRCAACHEVHDAAGAKLLPAATITDSCNTCHDGTGGKGVYGAIEAQTGIDPAVAGGMHSVDTTSVVPGGDAGTGGSATMAFAGPGSTLTCGDCHSPHNSNVVEPYSPERWRTTYNLIQQYNTKTSHLLRQRPGDTTATVAVYGSDWCAACHAGRSSGGTVHNHPVDSKATTATPFYYDYIVKLASDGPTSVTTTGTLARSNRGYLMPYPRTAQQGAHKPICQQCHEDTRNVGTLSDATGTAAAFVITATDGQTDTDNPRFQNFPHETLSPSMLVEDNDDLCLNCHPLSQLP
jgi:predicted CXXCH cytochrome family protein